MIPIQFTQPLQNLVLATPSNLETSWNNWASSNTAHGSGGKVDKPEAQTKRPHRNKSVDLYGFAVYVAVLRWVRRSQTSQDPFLIPHSQRGRWAGSVDLSRWSARPATTVRPCGAHPSDGSIEYWQPGRAPSLTSVARSRTQRWVL